MNPKKILSQEEKQYFLSLKRTDITHQLLQDLFADKYDTKTNKIIPCKFNTYDEFDLKSTEYFNKEDVHTNCGLFIFNKFIIEKSFSNLVGYCNKPLDKKELGRIKGIIDTALLEDDITTQQYVHDFLQPYTWLEYTFNTEITTSLTLKGMVELPAVKKKKKELMKEYADDLNSDDNNKKTVAATKMESELLKVAREEMKDDPSMDLYNSGARGAFDNAYKNGQVMTGPVYNLAKHEYEIVYKPLTDGLEKKSVPTMANSVIGPAYAGAIATGECGYMTKKINAAFQSAQLDDRGTDCHTKGYDTVTITKDNYIFYSYNFIIEGNKLVRLDSKTKDKYIGKTVKIRSNAYCTGKKTCNMCAGDKFYLIDKTNYGLTASKMANTLMQRRLKQKHDCTVKPYEIDVEKDFL